MLAAALLAYAVPGAAPASAAGILVAADHAELSANMAAEGVSRVAVLGDRIARVVRAPDGYRVEHDPGTGDLYLSPLPASPGETSPVALFIGTEKGFTYRLMLTPVEGGPAQILIRNPAVQDTEARRPAAEDPRVAAIVQLVRAVAQREPLAGYAIEAGGGAPGKGTDLPVIEMWRGKRLAAWVLRLGADAPSDPAMLAARLGRGVLALWLAAPAGREGDRLAVAVLVPDRSPGPAGSRR